MSEGEVWKDVVGYEGQYQVSNKGNVRSVDRINHIGSKYSGRMLKPWYQSGGYLQVGLCKNGKVMSKYIHRLVLEAFVDNPNNLPEVNHLDENKTNNELPNLEWCDSSYNSKYGTRIRRIAQKQSKKVRAVNIETGEVLTFNSTQEAVRKGYNSGGVSQACRGHYKSATGKLIGDGHTYKGHRWSYI